MKKAVILPYRARIAALLIIFFAILTQAFLLTLIVLVGIRLPDAFHSLLPRDRWLLGIILIGFIPIALVVGYALVVWAWQGILIWRMAGASIIIGDTIRVQRGELILNEYPSEWLKIERLYLSIVPKPRPWLGWQGIRIGKSLLHCDSI